MTIIVILLYTNDKQFALRYKRKTISIIGQYSTKIVDKM